MASVMQGDAYNIPVTIKSGNGTLITPEIAACVEITVGQFAKRWPGQVTFDEKTGEWQFPVTQKQTFRFAPGAAVVQARVVFQDGSIMGGSGAPVSVVQSASRGTLPQPEKTETVTGSAPKATEVTIPTGHDINVSLHSQVILSDPIKAPYIGDNGSWYEYDAATGEFVDTGVKAGGGTDPSLGLTGAAIGQIIKVKAVDTDGKPTAWEAVDDSLPNPSPSDVGSALAVEQIGEFEYGYGFTHIPNLNDFIGLGIDNASPGQFAKVKYVNDVGIPTAWEAVDMAGGGGETWEKIAEIIIPDGADEATVLTISKDLDGNPFSLVKARLCAKFPKYTGVTSIPNYSYAMLNGKISGRVAPLAYTSAWPKVSASVVTGTVYEIDVSGAQQIERVERPGNAGWSDDSRTDYVVYGGSADVRGTWFADTLWAKPITSIGGAGMLIYPRCRFVLYGVRV